MRVDNPKEVGADRIVNAVAALELYGAPCIIVDLGRQLHTTTLILPSSLLAVRLHQELGSQRKPYIRRLRSCRESSWSNRRVSLVVIPLAAMQAGIIFGYVGQVDGIVERVLRI